MNQSTNTAQQPQTQPHTQITSTPKTEVLFGKVVEAKYEETAHAKSKKKACVKVQPEKTDLRRIVIKGRDARRMLEDGIKEDSDVKWDEGDKTTIKNVD